MVIRQTRKFRRMALAVLAAVTAVVFLVPGSASAGTDLVVYGQNGAGHATFHAHGEHLYVMDHSADGWGVRAQIQKLEWAPEGYRYWKDHSSVCFDDTSRGDTPSGASHCNYSLPEGKEVRIHLWFSRNGTYSGHRYSEVGTA